MRTYRATRAPGTPPGLFSEVKAVEWKEHGDHPAVTPVTGLKHASGEVVNGAFVLIDVPGIVRRTDADGNNYDYVVLPGHFVVENPNGEVWAVPPTEMAAWFEAV